MSALRYVYAPHFFFLSVLISLHDENRKTLESLLFILIFGLFRTATRTIEATFSRLTSTFHRKEKEMNVRDTRRNSSPTRLRTWEKETFQKYYVSRI